jgi:LmbE family N-acetylglucosaminyl deacetylase
MPKTNKKLNILIITPHLDDAFIGMGGTILQFIRDKYKITIIELFDSIENSGNRAILDKIQIECISLKNIEVNHSSILMLMDLFRKFQPDKAFLCINGSHLDHMKGYEISMRALQLMDSDIKSKHNRFYVKSVYIFESIEALLKNSYEPNELFLDITKEFSKKLELIRMFKKLNAFTPKLCEYVMHLNKLRGWHSNVDYAELFIDLPIHTRGEIFDSVFDNTLVIDEQKKAHEKFP